MTVLQHSFPSDLHFSASPFLPSAFRFQVNFDQTHATWFVFRRNARSSTNDSQQVREVTEDDTGIRVLWEPRQVEAEGSGQIIE